MKLNPKKMWPLAAASLIAFTSLVHADSNTCTPVCQREGNMMRDGEGPDGEICPAVRPKCQDGDWNITVAAFVWNAHEDGLEFATQNFNNAPNPFVLVEAEFLGLDSKWTWGYRLGIGYTFEHDGWDLALTWTNFKNHMSETAIADEDEGVQLIPYWSDFAVAGEITATTADAHWKLKLDYLDLELGRDFWVSKWLSLRPFAGLRGVWIKQDYDLEYRGGNLSAPSGTPLLATQIVLDEMDSHYKGVGILGGINTQWGFCGGFSIYGDLALSIIYGRFDIDYEEESQLIASPFTKSDIGEIEDHFRVARLITDLALGVRYEHTCGEKKNYHFMLSLGWEQHVFFGQNNFLHVQNTNTGGTNSFMITRAHGDLTTQGWTLTASLDF